MEILHVRDHPFKKRPAPGCAECGRAKTHMCHHGAPQSLNALGSGNPRVFQALKKAWTARLTELLEGASLERGLESVVVEGQVCFPDRRPRDQGNIRFMVEKALGDTLVAGGWLPDDQFFPVRRYEFGGLEPRHERGQSWIRLLVMPS